MVRGSCPVLSPFLGCVSGSSELDWRSVELLRTYEVRFSASESALHPGLCLGWAHWVFQAMSFRGSLSWGWGGVSFAFVPGFVAKTQGPSLAPWFAGFTVPAQPMGDCYILYGRSGVTWFAWAAHRQRCERFLFAAGCSMKELSKTNVSFWLRMPLSRVCRLSVTERSVLCPLSLVRSCCRSVSSLRRTLLSSWWKGEDVALTLILARLLEAVASRVLAAFHRFCVVAVQALVLPGPARLDISLLTTWRLVLWPCFLVRPPTIRSLPMGFHGWQFVYVSIF